MRRNEKRDASLSKMKLLQRQWIKDLIHEGYSRATPPTELVTNMSAQPGPICQECVYAMFVTATTSHMYPPRKQSKELYPNVSLSA